MACFPDANPIQQCGLYNHVWAGVSFSSFSVLLENMFLTVSTILERRDVVDAVLHTLLRRRWPSGPGSGSSMCASAWDPVGASSQHHLFCSQRTEPIEKGGTD